MSNQAILLAGGGDPFFSSVVSLLFNDNAANGTTTFSDQAPPALQWARTGAVVYTTSNPPTGMTSSVSFPGSGGNSVTLNPFTTISAFALPGDFTIEFMIRYNGIAQTSGVVDFRNAGSDATRWSTSTQSSTYVYFFNAAVHITGSMPSDLTWAHYAICKSGTSTKMFLNGAQTGSTFSDATTFPNAAPTIGNVNPGTNPLLAQMASLRITKGVARYTAAFTPPTLPLPNH